jgi:hypothetical protein
MLRVLEAQLGVVREFNPADPTTGTRPGTGTGRDTGTLRDGDIEEREHGGGDGDPGTGTVTGTLEESRGRGRGRRHRDSTVTPGRGSHGDRRGCIEADLADFGGYLAENPLRGGGVQRSAKRVGVGVSSDSGTNPLPQNKVNLGELPKLPTLPYPAAFIAPPAPLAPRYSSPHQWRPSSTQTTTADSRRAT